MRARTVAGRLLGRFVLKGVGMQRLFTDALAIVASLYLSLWLRTDPASFEQHLPALSRWVLVFLGIRLLCFLAFGVYQAMWRFSSVPDVIRLAQAIAFSIPLLISCTYVFPKMGYVPRSVFFIDGFVALALLTAIRLTRRRAWEWSRRSKAALEADRILIYGAGLAGRLLAQHLANQPDRRVKILGYVDDDPAKQNMVIGGIPVLGNGRDLDGILLRWAPSGVIVAMKDRPPALLRELLLACRQHAVPVQILDVFRLESSTLKPASLYREVDVTDLLRRPPSQIDVSAVQGMLEGRVVLVTGAGGSIGSELSRQIARFRPARLLLLDHSEFNLYAIDRELRNGSEGDRVVPLLVDIKDQDQLRAVFRAQRPNAVFHAAAYKHVHLVEANPVSSILNNVVGTKHVLDLCEQHAVERFLLISSDKAVNPAGIMGATKRVCERLTAEKARQVGRPYSSVRFGNVLGSSGSVVPLLKSQIEAGGPVTLTHPEMTRYFMLIPEAVSLVLMASFLARPGDIAVLSMGDPIRIVDLAQSLMTLMGKDAGEVPIVFTGIRPGEKLFEELYLTGDELRTPHRDILTVPRGDGDGAAEADPTFRFRMNRLIELALAHDEASVAELQALAGGTHFDAVASATNPSRVPGR